MRLLARSLPALYLLYMRLVAATGHVTTAAVAPILEARQSGRPVALALLHQDLFCCPFLFRDLGVLTVASAGDAGDIISTILERCGFEVARGGTSSRDSRRRPVLDTLVAAIDANAGSIIAVTPDGSRGPAGAVQPGVALLASRTGAQLFCLKIHARPALYMPTWDRTMIPLPFARIRVDIDGPIEAPIPPDRRSLEACRADLEQRLHALHAAAFARAAVAPVPALTTLHAARRVRASARSRSD